MTAGRHPPHRFRAVVFDLDGTLIDSAPDIADAINMVMAELDRRALTEATVRRLIGSGWAGLLERVMALTGGRPERGMDWVQERFAACYLPRSTRLAGLYPTVLETLRALHAQGLGLGICTNKRQIGADVAVEALGIGEFMGAVIGGDTGVMKPDPRHVAAVLARLGVEAGDALMVGDSVADVDAARGLDMAVVAVRYGYGAAPAEALGADRAIDRLSDLHGVMPLL